MEDDDETAHRKKLERDWGCELLVKGSRAQVVITTAMAKHFHALDVERRKKATRAMEWWCEGRPIPDNLFNPMEGRSANGTMLQAFKTWAHRLYGFVTNIDGMRTFVIVDCDPSKKRTPANQAVLKRARGRVDAFGKGK